MNNEKSVNIIINWWRNKFINYLNNYFNHYLLCLEKSWYNIPRKYIYRLNNEYWDIRIFKKYILSKLNHSDNGCPYPLYPTNPFTSRHYESKILLYFLNIVKDNNTHILNILKNYLLYYESSSNIGFTIKFLNWITIKTDSKYIYYESKGSWKNNKTALVN